MARQPVLLHSWIVHMSSCAAAADEQKCRALPSKHLTGVLPEYMDAVKTLKTALLHSQEVTAFGIVGRSKIKRRTACEGCRASS